jgi:hypothetical protein
VKLTKFREIVEVTTVDVRTDVLYTLIRSFDSPLLASSTLLEDSDVMLIAEMLLLVIEFEGIPIEPADPESGVGSVSVLLISSFLTNFMIFGIRNNGSRGFDGEDAFAAGAGV